MIEHVTLDGQRDLPDFARPPVDEVALSIQFAPLARFGVPHFGLYWQTIREHFPHFQVIPPLPGVTEQFEQVSPIKRVFGVELVTQPDVRVWFLNLTGNDILQVQRDRFIRNWRRINESDVYPRYEAVRELLVAEWERFCVFLRAEKIDPPQVNQCEVTYVNHLETGNGWRNYGEVHDALAPWSGAHSGSFLPPPERLNMEVHYRLPEKAGRLHIAVEPVIRGRDAREVLQITLTARGAPASPACSDIVEWLDLGREWVVRGFTDFTTTNMHNIWGRSR